MMISSRTESLGDGLSNEQQEKLLQIVFGTQKGTFLAPFLMGLVVDCFFCGILIHQFLTWRRHKLQERRFTKIIVYSMISVAIAATIFAIVFCTRAFVYMSGQYAPFVQIRWLQGLYLGYVVVATIAQTFYAERIYRLLNRPTLFLCLVVPGMLLGVVCLIVLLFLGNTKYPNIFDAAKLNTWILCEYIGQAYADFIITGFTVYTLWRSKTGWKQTDMVLNRLVRFTFETQLPPTLFAIASLAYYSRHSESSFSVFFAFTLSKPFAMSVMAVLNGRESIRKQMTAANPTNIFTMKPTTNWKGGAAPGVYLNVDSSRQDVIEQTAGSRVSISRQQY